MPHSLSLANYYTCHHLSKLKWDFKSSLFLVIDDNFHKGLEELKLKSHGRINVVASILVELDVNVLNHDLIFHDVVSTLHDIL